MKAFITICHKNHAYDPTLSYLFRAFEKVNNVQDCDVVIMPITYQNEYVADEQLMYDIESSGKKIIIVDFVEYGWDVAEPNHFFGVNTQAWENKFQNKEYFKLDMFIWRNTPRIALYFKRELVSNPIDTPYKVLPIEYPGVSTLPEYNPEVSYEEYTNRPIDIIMTWGLSNPSRPILHGELVKQSALNGQHLVSNIAHFTTCQKRGEKRMAVIAHIPDFARVSNLELLHLQSMAKISISLSGAGSKCFRSAESPYNSVMAIQENNLEWSYPWINGANCIELPNRQYSFLIDENKSYGRLMHYLESPKYLYGMYLQGIDNWKNYDLNNYASDYVLKEISKACQ
jgi:hypothetical protein